MSKKTQLIAIGAALGLKIANNAREDTIAKKVAEKKGVTVDELYASLTVEDIDSSEDTKTEDTTAEEKPAETKASKPPAAEKKYKVIVHSNDPLSKDREYFIGHNGVPFKGEYEVETQLTGNLIKILKDASTDVEESVFDEHGQPTGKTKTVSKKRFLIETVIDE